MKDILELMLRLPADIARIGAEQMQNSIRQNENVSTESYFDDVSGPQSFGDDFHQSSIAGTFVPPSDDRRAPVTRTGEQNVALGSLDLSTLVVVGDSFMAGEGSFSLAAASQQNSICAQLARQAGVGFKQLNFEALQLSSPFGSNSNLRFPDHRWSMEPRVTSFGNQSNLVGLNNYSIPRYRLIDALDLVTSLPTIQSSNSKHSLANIVLANPHQAQFTPQTQLQMALERHPTFMMICLGFWDIAEPLFCGHPEEIPRTDQLVESFDRLFRLLHTKRIEGVVFNVANPIDTAAYSTIEQAAHVLCVPGEFLISRYRLSPGDRLTVSGLVEIGVQINRGTLAPLLDKHILRSELAEQVTGKVNEVNQFISSQLRRDGQIDVFDLASMFARLEKGDLASSSLSSHYLGGFFALNGYSLGDTANALIANQLSSQLNSKYLAEIPAIDTAIVAQSDSVADSQIAGGSMWSMSRLNLSLIHISEPTRPY